MVTPLRMVAPVPADIAASLGLSVLAEGVETDAERDTLLALEVTVGQGFGLHRPMFVDDLAALLANPGDA
jgi:EAL domain-containing protein (putative c-di-GMP-specific phosphodiesterase class I)